VSTPSNDLRILVFIEENGPQRFTDLINNKELKLSRNTVNKYINQLRNDGFLDVSYEGKNKFNELTTKGKIRVENYFGKNNIKNRLKAYHLFEQQIKERRDKFLALFGNIPNHMLMDCMENLLDFEKMKFTLKLPSEEFKYYLAFFLARFNIEYAKSDIWRKLQPPVVQLSQKDFIIQFKLNEIEVKYFCQEWSKIRYHFDILDEDNNIWYLSSNTILYEIIMIEIVNRARRGSLQEILFDNFIFNVDNEVINILDDGIKSAQLELDLRQKTGLVSFITSMMKYFLGERKGYKRPWDNLPSDNQILLTMALDYEAELNNISDESVRKSEIMRTLHYIYGKLNNLEEAFYWGEEFIKADPGEGSILMVMIFMYYKEKRYDDFLRLVELSREKFDYNHYIKGILVDYYIDVVRDFDKALELIEEIERLLLSNPSLSDYFRKILGDKAQIYFKKSQIHQSLIYAERAWNEFGARNTELYNLIVDLYKLMENWESLEDFCLVAYIEDEFNPDLYPSLYFAYLKRNSTIKAEDLYAKVVKYYPDYIKVLDEINRKNF